jgi:hypothetical protein
LLWHPQRYGCQPFGVGPGEHKVIVYETEYSTDSKKLKSPFQLWEFVPNDSISSEEPRTGPTETQG